MCGKLFAQPLPEPLTTYNWLLYHAHSDIEGGLHNTADSHGGIDTSLVLFLLQLGGRGLIAWRRHDDPIRNHWCIDWDRFLQLAVFRSGGGRFRLFVPDALRTLMFFEAPRRWLPKYELGVLPHDPRGTYKLLHPEPRKEPIQPKKRPHPAQPALFET